MCQRLCFNAVHIPCDVYIFRCLSSGDIWCLSHVTFGFIWARHKKHCIKTTFCSLWEQKHHGLGFCVVMYVVLLTLLLWPKVKTLLNLWTWIQNSPYELQSPGNVLCLSVHHPNLLLMWTFSIFILHRLFFPSFTTFKYNCLITFCLIQVSILT